MLWADNADFAAGTTVNSVANPITLTGAFRFRAGFTSNRDFGVNADGFGNDDDDDTGTYVDARVNVAFDFALSKNVTARLDVIGADLFENNEASHDAGGFDDLDIYEAYVILDKLLGHDEIGARIGRQEIVLGNELFFGNNSFFGGETFDAAIAWWAQEEFSLHFVWAKFTLNETYNASNHPYPAYLSGRGFDDDEAYALYFTLNTIENHVLDLYYYFWNGNNFAGGLTGTLGNAIPGDTFAHVFGFRLAAKDLPVADGLDYNFELAYETGDIDSLGVEVEGLIIEATLGITFDAESKFRVYGSFIFAEGPDGDSGFVPLFTDRHNQVNWDDHTAFRARWGLMDIIPMTNVLAGPNWHEFPPINRLDFRGHCSRRMAS